MNNGYKMNNQTKNDNSHSSFQRVHWLLVAPCRPRCVLHSPTVIIRISGGGGLIMKIRTEGMT